MAPVVDALDRREYAAYLHRLHVEYSRTRDLIYGLEWQCGVVRDKIAVLEANLEKHENLATGYEMLQSLVHTVAQDSTADAIQYVAAYKKRASDADAADETDNLVAQRKTLFKIGTDLALAKAREAVLLRALE